ncbi:RNA polymerase-binding protein DksA [Buchnera aphidicola (Chaitoregma tattakana)]|uniref:RNA polymerase-binding protein DksA n=1 Tax=Buchnera aphidicola TaxID=9 RepID=UPI0031B8A50B
MKTKKNKKISSLSILSIAGVKPYKKKKNEKYMSKKQIEHFKKILEAWKNQTENKMKYTDNNISQEQINFPDPIDRAVQEEEFSLKLQNNARDIQIIKKIKNTLKKIELNNFGYCESCDVKIGIKRLEARPTATLCIDCKTVSEIRDKQIVK